MRKDMLVFGQPLISDDEIQEVIDSLKKGWLGTGPKVAQFEKDFAAYKNSPYSAAVNSCTAALHLACLSLDLKKGDEIITTANTFCATVNAIILSGATPVIADIDPETLNIDPKEIEAKITKNTKAILVVHFAGLPCDMDAIMRIAKKYNLSVIEDCAHAIESSYDDQPTGTFGDIGCFSFYATKNITTGEGGMLISSNKEKMDRIKIMALHGMSADAWSRFSDKGYKHYHVVDKGFKYNMMDLQAAIGLHQLKLIDQYHQKRETIWNAYNEALKDTPLKLPVKTPDNIKHAYHLYTVQIDSGKTAITRDEFLNQMTQRNIGVGVHYTSIASHPYYQKELGLDPANYPNAARYGESTLSLPISPKLTQTEVDEVIETVKDILKS